MSEPVQRVIATTETLALLEQLKQKHGKLMFHQSGGCCDGSTPMCYSQGDLLLGDQDIKLGMLGDYPFYMTKSQYEYWQHMQLIIDVSEGKGGMFSLESSEGKRFITQSRLFTEEELPHLVEINVES